MDKCAAVMTGFGELDELTGGLSGGQMIVVGGRPGMGKSAFAMNIANYVLRQGKNGVVVFSIEMSEDQYIRRCIELGMGAGQRESLRVVEQIPEVTPEEIKVKLLALREEMDIALVVIDYLQLMGCGEKKSSRWEETACVVAGLKELATETDLPILVLSQLTRACEMRAVHRPLLSDFADGSCVPQVSDVILLLYREAYYRGDPLRYGDYEKYIEYITEARNGRDDAEVIVAKHPSVAELPIVVHLMFNPMEGFQNFE